jgi:chemotaxis response regulator CheB
MCASEDEIRVILADDHALLRQGTTELLNREPDIRVVGEAENGQQAVDLANELRPDVVIMDVRMPVLSGIEATKMIRDSLPQVHVLVLTAHEDDQYVFSLLQAGAPYERDGLFAPQSTAKLPASSTVIGRGSVRSPTKLPWASKLRKARKNQFPWGPSTSLPL